MANPLDPNANPFVSGGMRRRLTDAAAPRQYEQQITTADTFDPYEGNYAAETARSVARRTAAGVPAIESLGRKLLGDDEGAQVAAREAMRQEQIADEQGPDVQRFDQVDDVGSALKFAGYQAASLVPDLAMSLTGAGVGAAVGRRAGVGLARRSAQALARREAAPSRYSAMREAYKKAADAPGATRQMQRDAAVTAAKNANKGVDAAAADAARVVGLRTPLAQARVDRLEKFGQLAGATAGQFPGMNRENAELLADEDTDQADAGKLLLGTTAASAIGALPIDRFLSRFGGAEAVKGTAERFLPRVAKEAGKQGLAEGTAEVAQTATQLAAHKWVNDNIDLLGPEAFNQYLAAFVGGSLAGGMLGGAGEAGRATRDAVRGAELAPGARSALGAAANTAKDVGGSLRDRMRSVLSSTADRVRAKRGAAPVSDGETAPAADEGKGFSADDLMQTARDVAAGAGRAASAAQKKWEEFRATLVRHDDIEASTDGAAALAEGFEKGADAKAPIGRNAQSNPIELPTKLQNVLAANFDRSHPIWEFPEEVSGLFASAEKLFTGDEITPLDQDRIDVLKRALPPGVVDVWESAGDKYGPDLIRATQADATEDDEADAIAEMRGETNEGAPQVAAPAAVDEPPSARVANLAAAGKAARTDEERAAYRQQYTEAVSALRSEILGPTKAPDAKGFNGVPFGKNTIWLSSNKPENVEAFNKKLADAGRVEMLQQQPHPTKPNESVRVAVSIDSLVNKALAQNERDFPRTPEGQATRRRSALFSVFGDLKLAGVKINPNSITAGDLGTASNGTYLGRITPADVAQLREQFEDFEGGVDDLQPRAGDEQLDADFARSETREARQGEDVVDAGIDVDANTLAARTEPPGATTNVTVKRPGEKDTLATEFVPTTGVVSEADANDPYAAVVARVNKAMGRQQGSLLSLKGDTYGSRPVKTVSPAERRRLALEAGREIGRAEIERDPEFSDRSKARMLRRLETDDDLAANYFKRAERGAFVTAKARELPEDKAQRLTGKGRDQDLDLRRYPKKARERVEAGREALPGPAPNTPDPVKNATTAPDNNVPKKSMTRYDDIDSVAGKTDGDHDYARETEMLNRLLGDLGIAAKVNVGPYKGKSGGTYNVGTHRIEINPALKGPVRAEVLMHELGHHIVYQTAIGHLDPKLLSKLQAEGRHETFDDFVIHMLSVVDPPLHKALMADYEKWLSQRNHDAEGYVPVGESAAPLHRMSMANKNKDRLQDMHEWLADNIARALTTQKRPVSTIEKFFSKIATALRSAWRKLTKNERSKFKPAKSVDAWVRQMYSAADARRALGAAIPAAAAKAAEVAAVNAMVPAGRLRNMKPNKAPVGMVAMTRFVRDRLTPDERMILERAVGTGAADRRLRELYKDEPGLIKLFDSQSRSMEARIAAAYFAWARGNFTTGPNSSSVMRGLSDDLGLILGFAGNGAYAQQLFRDIESGALERIRAAGREYDVKVRTRRAENLGKVDEMLVRLGDVTKKISDPWNRFIDGKGTVMRSWGIPAMRQLDALLHQRGGSTDKDRGLNNAIVHRTALFLQKAGAALNGLSQRDQARVMRILQAQLKHDDPNAGSKEVWKAAAAVRKLMDEAYDYAVKAGLDIPRTEDYFPVVVDIRNDAAKAKLHALLSQEKFKQAIADQGTTVDDLVAYAARRDDFGTATTGSNAPNFKAQNKRTMAFVYKLGDAADHKAFAALQAKDPAEVFASYFEPLVKRAEYARRFDEDGAELDSIIAAARNQGATDAQVKYALGTVEAALGTYAAQGSPVLRALSPALAERLKGRKSQAVIDGIQAYQNVRLLPLATLSSLVDPMGIAVRTGGDFATAWKGFKLGVRALYDQSTREDLHRMLATLGATEDLAGAQALHTGFGGSQSPAARRVNDFIFRANGLSQWTQTTRFMALEAAHAFLIKHAGSSSETSKRYLAELGLTRADIGVEWHVVGDQPYPRVRMTNIKGTVDGKDVPDEDRNERVKKALLRFVDESILRPNPQQMPLWHSDPYMGLVTQYKSFAYAIFDQIGSRIMREIKKGNYRVLLPALAYVPMALFAELIRELLQHGPEGNPNREDWGPAEYTAMAAEKSSLTGPRWGFYVDAAQDVSEKRIPGSSQIGPTLGQVRNTASALNGRRDLGKTFEESLPLSPLWKAWNDDGLVDNIPIVAAYNLANGES